MRVSSVVARAVDRAKLAVSRAAPPTPLAAAADTVADVVLGARLSFERSADEREHRQGVRALLRGQRETEEGFIGESRKCMAKHMRQYLEL